jgi:hypothetical protein
MNLFVTRYTFENESNAYSPFRFCDKFEFLPHNNSNLTRSNEIMKTMIILPQVCVTTSSIDIIVFTFWLVCSTQYEQ